MSEEPESGQASRPSRFPIVSQWSAEENRSFCSDDL
jgi:hypothetical protein